MKTVHEVRLSLSKLDKNGLQEFLRSFADHTDTYVYLEAESDMYSKAIGGPGVVVYSSKTDTTESAAISFARVPKKMSRKDRILCEIASNRGEVHNPDTGLSKLYIANVVPKDKSQLSKDEYNFIVERFVGKFRKYTKDCKLPIAIEVSRDISALKQIIRGRKCCELFQRFLQAYPTSYHPLDIARLDRFICAISKYRCSVDWDNLASYLKHPVLQRDLFLIIGYTAF